MDRRTFLASATATAGIAALAPSKIVSAAARDGVRNSWRIPGEYERSRAVWLAYEKSDPEYGSVMVRMAEALHPYADLVIVADSEDNLGPARSAMAEAGILDRVSYLHDSTSRLFIRDYNVFSVAPGQLGVVDFQFNTYGLPGWCANHLYPGEPERAAKCAAFGDTEGGKFDLWAAKVRNAAVFSSPLFLEGGAIEVNGKGTIIVSEPLALQRNIGSTRPQLEKLLLQLPGIRKVIWLAEGLAEDPQMKATITGDYIGFGAGYHTDEFVRFADPQTILLAWVEPRHEELHPVEAISAERMQRNYDILSQATDQDGRPLRIVKVPTPAPMEKSVVLQEKAENALSWTASMFPASEGRKVGDRLTHIAAASYLNYVVANNLVLVPSYTEHGTPAAVQERVHSIFSSAFPRRDIKFIDVGFLNWLGGGIHCATCNEPAVT